MTKPITNGFVRYSGDNKYLTDGRAYRVRATEGEPDLACGGVVGPTGFTIIDNAGDYIYARYPYCLFGSWTVVEEDETVSENKSEEENETMSKQEYISFGVDLHEDFVLRDATAYKPYLITRHLAVGDKTFAGATVDEPGVEFVDDEGDTVAIRLSGLKDKGIAFAITDSPDVADRGGAEKGDEIIILDAGMNQAFCDTTIGKAYIISAVIDPGEANSYFGIEADHSKIEYIDDVGDVVSYIPGFNGAKHKIVKAAA